MDVRRLGTVLVVFIALGFYQPGLKAQKSSKPPLLVPLSSNSTRSEIRWFRVQNQLTLAAFKPSARRHEEEIAQAILCQD
jgi:hypothetical protein